MERDDQSNPQPEPEMNPHDRITILWGLSLWLLASMILIVAMN
jgi:hypothetical protein